MGGGGDTGGAAAAGGEGAMKAFTRGVEGGQGGDGRRGAPRGAREDQPDVGRSKPAPCGGGARAGDVGSEGSRVGAGGRGGRGRPYKGGGGRGDGRGGGGGGGGARGRGGGGGDPGAVAAESRGLEVESHELEGGPVGAEGNGTRRSVEPAGVTLRPAVADVEVRNAEIEPA